MKTILLMLAMVGLTLGNTYAQSCACNKHKHHKTTVHHKKTRTTTTAALPAVNIGETVYQAPVEPCTRYRKHNIVVTECPSSFYSNADIDKFESEGMYMGNYPTESGTMKATIQLPEAPQHTTIDNYKGIAPANGNACEYNCSSY